MVCRICYFVCCGQKYYEISCHRIVGVSKHIALNIRTYHVDYFGHPVHMDFAFWPVHDDFVLRQHVHVQAVHVHDLARVHDHVLVLVLVPSPIFIHFHRHRENHRVSKFEA